MWKKQVFALAAALLLLGVGDASGQSFFVRGGTSLANAENGGTPFSGGLGVRLDYIDFVRLQGSFDFHTNLIAASNDQISADQSYGRATSVEGAALVFPLQNDDGLNPYAYVGLGRYLSIQSDAADWQPETVVPVGVGVEYPLRGGLMLNADVSRRMTLNTLRDGQEFDVGISSAWAPSIGITYNLGHAREVERDGGWDPILALFRGGEDTPADPADEPIAEAAPTQDPAQDDEPADTQAEQPQVDGVSRSGVPGPAPEAPTQLDTSNVEFWNGMARLPDGTFIMGLTDEDPLSLQTSGRKRVTISSFYMDRYAVTNAEYREFLEEVSPEEQDAMMPDPSVWEETGNRYSWEEYFEGDSYADHPVIGVTHEQAQRYCEFYNKRLPTEAEWEYAARSVISGSIYPWPGFEPRDDQGRYLANYNPGRGGYAADGYAFTAPVDAFPSNPWGLHNMSGNVAEWVQDAYTSSYADLSDFNPLHQDPDEDRRVIRGGSWASDAFHIGVGVRDTQPSNEATPYTGFRCAMDVAEAERQRAQEEEQTTQEPADTTDQNQNAGTQNENR